MYVCTILVSIYNAVGLMIASFFFPHSWVFTPNILPPKKKIIIRRDFTDNFFFKYG